MFDSIAQRPSDIKLMAGVGDRVRGLSDIEEKLILDDWAAGRGLGYTPSGLAMDGTTDNTTAIANAFAISKIVRLPATDIAGGQAIFIGDLTIPSGCKLIGAGMPTYDRTNNVWTGTGTLIRNARLIATGSSNVEMSDFAVDCFARGTGFTAIVGTSDATRNITVRRVATRANDHGQLWEKNANTGNAATDAKGDTVNNILIEDCLHYGGPNGIAVKMRGVIIRRTVCYDVTVQAFPIVSDIINGGGRYSRARDVLLQDCDAVDCAMVLHVYSRDNQSPTNTSGVLPAQNIRWVGGRLSGANLTHGAQIGDGAANDATITRIPCVDVWIIGADVRDNRQAGIKWDTSIGGGYDECNFDGNGYDSNFGGGDAYWGVRASTAFLPGGGAAVSNLTHGKSNSASATCAGHETGYNALQSQNGGATRTLTSGQQGLVQTNRASSGALTLTLPTPKENAEYSFFAASNVGITVVPAVPATNRIRSDNALYNSAATTGPTHAGCFITFKCIKAGDGTPHWLVTALRGAWTFA